MKVTQFTRRVLAFRREDIRMRALGYHRQDLINTMVGDGWRRVITEAKISADGKAVWVKSEIELPT